VIKVFGWKKNIEGKLLFSFLKLENENDLKMIWWSFFHFFHLWNDRNDHFFSFRKWSFFSFSKMIFFLQSQNIFWWWQWVVLIHWNEIELSCITKNHYWLVKKEIIFKNDHFLNEKKWSFLSFSKLIIFSFFKNEKNEKMIIISFSNHFHFLISKMKIIIFLLC
jgi:hypothetical protein